MRTPEQAFGEAIVSRLGGANLDARAKVAAPDFITVARQTRKPKPAAAPALQPAVTA